jgi:tetratricopeptide (TPR) repeat protein
VWQGVPALLALGLLLATVVVARRVEADRFFTMGQRLTNAGRWEEAANDFVQAQAWNPLQARYLGAEAETRMRIQPPQWNRAESALRRAIRLDWANAWHRWQLAIVLTSVPGAGPAEFAQGERLLREALKLDPVNRPKVYGTLAELYLRWNRAPDAALVYDAAVARYLGAPPTAAHVPLLPDHIDLMAEAAEFRLGVGDGAGARGILQALLGDGARATSRPSVIALTERLQPPAAVPPAEVRTRR